MRKKRSNSGGEDQTRREDADDENESAVPLPSSRLIVQNLPRSCDEARLRDVFSATGGIITDVRVCRLQQNNGSVRDFGSSRRFGFVGFKSVEEAVEAHKYFNSTFIDSSRISVNFAQRVKSSSLPRPWSKYTEGSSKHAKVRSQKVFLPLLALC